MNQDRHLRATALIHPIAKLGAVARLISLDCRQIAEIDIGERLADRRQRRWLHRRVECQHGPDNTQDNNDYADKHPKHFAHCKVLCTGYSPDTNVAAIRLSAKWPIHDFKGAVT